MVSQPGFKTTTTLRIALERNRAFKYIAIMEGIFAISLFAGMHLFAGKWMPAVELGVRSPEFADLHLPSGHFGFIFSVHNEMPANATVRQENLQDCDASGLQMNAMPPPCYPGLHYLFRHLWFVTLVCPLIPVCIAMLEVLRQHRSDGKTHSTHLRGALDNKEGRRHLRFLVYLSGVVFLQVWCILKRHAELAMGINFDPSDTISTFFGCGAIAIREVAHITLAQAPGAMAVSIIFCLFTAVQLYYVFWTARYFHFPSEVFAGGALGALFSFGFVHLTTSEHLLKNVFGSSTARDHSQEQGKPLLTTESH